MSNRIDLLRMYKMESCLCCSLSFTFTVSSSSRCSSFNETSTPWLVVELNQLPYRLKIRFPGRQFLQPFMDGYIHLRSTVTSKKWGGFDVELKRLSASPACTKPYLRYYSILILQYCPLKSWWVIKCLLVLYSTDFKYHRLKLFL